jgi:hypothetical protein
MRKCFICGSQMNCKHREEGLKLFNRIPEGLRHELPQEEELHAASNSLSREEYRTIMEVMRGGLLRKSPQRATRSVEKRKLRDIS